MSDRIGAFQLASGAGFSDVTDLDEALGSFGYQLEYDLSRGTIEVFEPEETDD